MEEKIVVTLIEDKKAESPAPKRRRGRPRKDNNEVKSSMEESKNDL